MGAGRKRPAQREKSAPRYSVWVAAIPTESRSVVAGGRCAWVSAGSVRVSSRQAGKTARTPRLRVSKMRSSCTVKGLIPLKEPDAGNPRPLFVACLPDICLPARPRVLALSATRGDRPTAPWGAGGSGGEHPHEPARSREILPRRSPRPVETPVPEAQCRVIDVVRPPGSRPTGPPARTSGSAGTTPRRGSPRFQATRRRAPSPLRRSHSPWRP